MDTDFIFASSVKSRETVPTIGSPSSSKGRCEGEEALLAMLSVSHGLPLPSSVVYTCSTGAFEDPGAFEEYAGR